MSRRRQITQPEIPALPDEMAGEAREWLLIAEIHQVLALLESRVFRPRGNTQYRAPADVIALARKTVAARILREHDGAYETNALVIRSDGARYWTEFAPGMIRMVNHY